MLTTYENAMENTGIIKYILSRKKGQDFLAACLFLIVFQWSVIVYLYMQKEAAYSENKEIVIKNQNERIESLKKQNDYLFGLTKQVDSAKAKLEIFKIEKEMK